MLLYKLTLVCLHFYVCLQRSVDLNPGQRDLVLKVAELLVSKQECDSRAEFWVEKAAKLLPGNPAVFNLKVNLHSSESPVIPPLITASEATLLTSFELKALTLTPPTLFKLYFLNVPEQDFPLSAYICILFKVREAATLTVFGLSMPLCTGAFIESSGPAGMEPVVRPPSGRAGSAAS